MMLVIYVEPVERKLGETISCVSKSASSLIKMKPDVVYDVPLLKSLHQQLCDRHILKEVYNNVNIMLILQLCMHKHISCMHIHMCSGKNHVYVCT